MGKTANGLRVRFLMVIAATQMSNLDENEINSNPKKLNTNMTVFKLITQSTDSSEEMQVIRWNVDESVDEATWDCLVKQAEQFVHASPSDLRLYWFGEFPLLFFVY